MRLGLGDSDVGFTHPQFAQFNVLDFMRFNQQSKIQNSKSKYGFRKRNLGITTRYSHRQT